MPEKTRIRRALISVYDKTGIVDFARALHDEFGIEVISTGGTARTLTEAGIPVTLVEDVTGFPEMMDGRVKTLHPKIHAAILADRDNPEHLRQLAEQGIEPIDMVVVNLYPFEQTIAKPDCTFEQAIEMIDIGGPCLLRAAAKNHKHVTVICDPSGYKLILDHLRESASGEAEVSPHRLAARAFGVTRGYDGVIWDYLLSQMIAPLPESSTPRLPVETFLNLEKRGLVRYAENPHQSGAYYRAPGTCVGWRPVTHRTRELMSFNNYADASAALELCAELTREGDRLWDRFLTGQSECGTGLQPVNQRQASTHISTEHLTRRHLPHIQRPEATYFVTFRLRARTLSPDERDIVLRACTYWHTRKMTLYAACVMPDHVHLLFAPHEIQPNQWVSLGELMHSIKRYSAREINKLRGVQGSVWLDETFDRIIRDEAEFIEKWEYIEANSVTAGIVEHPGEYMWFWKSDAGYGEVLMTDRLETGPTGVDDRLQTGPTQVLPAVCFIKHTNACGVAVEGEALEAYRKAYLGDPNAAMGGILAVNFDVDAGFAEVVMETYQRWGKAAGVGGFFVEVWLAPSFDDDAVEVIRTKKKWGERVRMLAVGDMSAAPDPDEMDIKRIAGGVLMQSRDLIGLNENQWQVVTQRQPTEAEMDDLRLAWLVCKHTKSNAITICADSMLIGNGAGQMSRVMSCRIATWLAQENGHADKLKGAVAASDAFFPFRDGPDILADAGVTALIQPGGSKRDQEVIDAANERGLAMIFTGTRHFRH
ncbi:MAG: transposase [Planctomycetota bacterium]